MRKKLIFFTKEMFFLVFALFVFFESEEILSLRELLDTARMARSFRSNSEELKMPLYLQLEPKSYYSDGIVIENEDVIISGSA